MTSSPSLARRPMPSLNTVHDILGDLVARNRQDEMLTSVRQIPAREGKFRPIPGWVASALSEAYRAKAIQELYSHQAATAELIYEGKSCHIP
jgi:DEAD/DEAH box helicase domain-containing protein